MKFLLLITLTVLSSLQGLAGNGSHGGDAVVWFNIPLSKAVEKADRGFVLTPLGRRNIKKVETVEYVRAGGLVKKSPIIEEIKILKFPMSLAPVTDFFYEYPSFKALLLEAREKMGLITEGIPSESGNYDYADEGTAFPTPNGTVRLQAVLRQVDTLFPDPDLIAGMDDLQRTLMQFHEEVYWIGSTKFKQQTSFETQLLILEIIANKRSLKDILGTFIKDYDKGVFATRSEIVSLREAYILKLEKFISGLESYKSTKNIKDPKLEFSLGTINGYGITHFSKRHLPHVSAQDILVNSMQEAVNLLRSKAEPAIYTYTNCRYGLHDCDKFQDAFEVMLTQAFETKYYISKILE